jgi:hypothetical protein
MIPAVIYLHLYLRVRVCVRARARIARARLLLSPTPPPAGPSLSRFLLRRPPLLLPLLLLPTLPSASRRRHTHPATPLAPPCPSSPPTCHRTRRSMHVCEAVKCFYTGGNKSLTRIFLLYIRSPSPPPTTPTHSLSLSLSLYPTSLLHSCISPASFLQLSCT